MALDPSIPMSFNPVAQGPNFNAALQGARNAWQLNAQQREAQADNVMRQIFTDPASLDKAGNPTPESMRRVMSVSPEAGMKLRQNTLIAQEHALQADLLKTKTFQQKYQMTNDVADQALTAYQTAIDAGVPKDVALQRGQSAWTQGMDSLKQSGLFSEAEQKGFRPQFDPASAQGHVWAYGDYMKWRTGQQREAREEASAGERERHDRAVEDHQAATEDAARRREDRIDRDAGATPAKAAERDAETIATANIGAKAKELGRPLTPAEEAAERQTARMAPKITEAAAKQDATVPQGEALDKAAKWYHETHELPPGFGGQATRRAVMEREAKMYPGTVFNVATMADVKADRVSLNNLQKQRDAATAYSRTADKEFDNLLGAIPKTPEPLNIQFLTNWVRSGSRELGGLQVPVWEVYLVSGLDEYAKVISGATGAAGSTDASREQAMKLIPKGSTSAQIREIVPAIKTGLKNRTDGYDTTISEIQRRLSDEPTPGTAGQTPATPQGGAKSYPIPSKKAIDLLRQNRDPEMFELTFGHGSAQKYLGQ